MKFRILFFLTVLLFSVGISLAEYPKQKQTLFLYYRVADIFYPAFGEQGRDWACDYLPIEVCTYYYDTGINSYVPFEYGKYCQIISDESTKHLK